MAGAGLLAVLAGSCCILPVGLALIGLGGSWISVLGPFVAYRSLILLGVVCVLLWAWIRIFRQRHSEQSSTRSVTITAAASLAFLAALSAPVWEREVAQYMWQSFVQTQ